MVYGDRKRWKSGEIGATATRNFKVLGVLISGEIDLHHLVDLEALLTTNSAPPESGQTTAGRRQIGEMFPAAPPVFEVFFDLFRSVFDFIPVMKVDAGIVAHLVLKFCDHRRWSVRRRVGFTRSHFGRRVRPLLAG
jgi:hypothetical protein